MVPKEGGIGRVWKARDKHLGREVALKKLKPEMALSKQVQWRFFHEAQVTAQLTHPNIVPAYELVHGGMLDSFYTMKWVEGPTLLEAGRAYQANRIAGGGQFNLRELLNAFVAVCNAIAYAHDRGVINRDLKGQNVVLGTHGEVHVLDWGLAKGLGHLEESSPIKPGELGTVDPDVQESREGDKRGTPAYMSPEQAGGELNFDQPTVVYGLGAVLYEILTGQPPFQPPFQHAMKLIRQALKQTAKEKPNSDCDDVLRELLTKVREDRARELLRAELQSQDEKAARSTAAVLDRVLQSLSRQAFPEILRKVREEELAPPRKVVPATPRPLEGVCVKAMAKQRGDRYQTTQELTAEVERWLADEPVGVYPDPVTVKVVRWARKHKPLAASMATAVLLLVVGAPGGVHWYQDYLKQRYLDAKQDENHLRRILNAAQQVHDEFDEQLRQRGGVFELQNDRQGWTGKIRQAQQKLGRAQELYGRIREYVDPELAKQMSELKNKLQYDEREWKIAARLGIIRELRMSMVENNIDYNYAKWEYPKAFYAAGIGLWKDVPKVVAQRVRALRIKEQLIAALDDWALVTLHYELIAMRRKKKQEEQHNCNLRERLLQVADLSDKKMLERAFARPAKMVNAF